MFNATAEKKNSLKSELIAFTQWNEQDYWMGTVLRHRDPSWGKEQPADSGYNSSELEITPELLSQSALPTVVPYRAGINGIYESSQSIGF